MVMQAIRERAQSWISWLIVGLIIIVMAAFGLNVYFEPESDVTVAKVEGAEIKYSRFQNAYEAERNQIMQQLRGVSPDVIEKLGIKDSVLNKLVDEEVLMQKVLDQGFAVGDAQLANYIHQLQIFHKDGRFDQDTYEQLLSSSNLTAQEWEQGQRKVMMMRQPESAVVNSAFVSNKALDFLIKLQNEQRTFGYAIFSAVDHQKDIEIKDEDAQAYYEKHKEDYMQPEQVSVEYVELSVAEIAKTVALDEEAIKQRYEDQKASFSVPERRRASHILIALDPEADKSTSDAAHEKANEILEKIKGGEPFEKLAKESSEDPGSAAQGGDLGFFERGIMDKAFEESAFSMKEGDLSGVVQSGFGLHIIKLTGIEAPTVKPIEDVRSTLEAGYRESQAEAKYFDLAERLDTLAFEHPDSLSVVAEQLGLEVKTSDLFSKDAGTGVAENPKVREAAFQADVFESGNNSPLVDLGSNHVVVLRKKDYQEKQSKPFGEVKPQIVNKLKRDRGSELAKEAAQKILAKAKEGATISDLFTDEKLVWHKPETIKRGDTSINAELVTAVFGEKHPADKEAAYGEIALKDGDYAIFMLTDVVEGERESIKDDELKSLRDRLTSNLGRTDYVSLVSSWRDQASITKYPEKLQ